MLRKTLNFFSQIKWDYNYIEPFSIGISKEDTLPGLRCQRQKYYKKVRIATNVVKKCKSFTFLTLIAMQKNHLLALQVLQKITAKSYKKDVRIAVNALIAISQKFYH